MTRIKEILLHCDMTHVPSVLCFTILFLFVKTLCYADVSRRKENYKYPPMSDDSKLSVLRIISRGGLPTYLLHLHEKLGPTFRVNLPNPYKMRFFSTDENLCKKILEDNDSIRPKRYKDFRLLHGDGKDIFTSNHKFWYHSRKGMMPAFSPNNMKKRGEIIDQVIDKFINTRLERLSLSSSSSSSRSATTLASSSFDPSVEMIYLTIKIMCSAAFQYNIPDTETESYVKNLELVMYDLRMRLLPLWKKLSHFIPSSRRAKKAGFMLQAFGLKILDHYRSLEKPAQGTIIDTIAKNPNYKSDLERANDIATLLFAGHDTTGNTLAWTLIALAQNPLIQKELNQHLLSLPEDERHESILLRNIIKESMRMFPVAAVSTHRVTSQDIFVPQANGKNDIFIPKNSNFSLATLLVGHDPTKFPNPEKFDPSRWDNQNTKHSFNAFLPFSYGRRSCVGQSFATVLLNHTIAKLCSKFYFEIDMEGHCEYKFTYRAAEYKLRTIKIE